MRRKTILGITTGAALAATTFLAGCGDDADEVTSRADYLRQANAACEQMMDDLAPAFEGLWAEFDGADMSDPMTADRFYSTLSEVMDQAEPAFRDVLEDLRDIAPPEGEGDRVEQLFDDYEAALDEVARLVERGADGDSEARAALESSADPFDDVDRRALEYGIRTCGGGST